MRTRTFELTEVKRWKRHKRQQTNEFDRYTEYGFISRLIAADAMAVATKGCLIHRVLPERQM
jgi:hypothetical protein